MKVLIADDDLSTRKILKKHLEEWGYEVLVSKNGDEAWNLLQQDGVRLAVLDWMMPGIEGVELCRRTREEKKSRYKYLILLTSKKCQEEVNRGLEAGADDYMIKPFHPLELKLRLQAGRRIIELEDSLLKAQEKLHHLATRDYLTGLLNRATIMERLNEELSRSLRVNSSVGVVMVDIDFFKKINDTYGHDVGDAVIVEIASRLKKSVRTYDYIGRYGGDEMLIILSGCDNSQLKKICHRIQASVSGSRIETEKGLLKVTISTGSASSEAFPRLDAESLVKISDRALYVAKSKGRNQSVISESAPHGEEREK